MFLKMCAVNPCGSCKVKPLFIVIKYSYFLFFIVLVFALIVRKQWWVKLLADASAWISAMVTNCTSGHIFHLYTLNLKKKKIQFCLISLMKQKNFYLLHLYPCNHFFLIFCMTKWGIPLNTCVVSCSMMVV